MSDPLVVLPPGKAVVFNGKGEPFEHIVRSLSPVKSGEILVKVLYTTLCGSDIHTYTGRRLEPPQVVLGHEIVGEIIHIDAAHAAIDLRGNTISAGDRVIWSIFSVPPGNTAPRPDMPQKSKNLFKYGHAPASGNDVFNGGLSEYCVLRNDTALIRISEKMPLPVAATISCAHSTVMGALRIAENISGKRVMIFGAGLLGLTCVAMCREAGASWVGLMDSDASRLAWGERFGANQTFHIAGTEDSAAAWPEADIVFDMTGSPEVMKKGMDTLATGGVSVWIGAVYNEKPVQVDAQQVVRKLLQIRGLHNYNYEDFLHATVFIENNYQKYPYEALIEKEYSLDEIEEAFRYATHVKPVRVGIKIS